MLDGIEVRLNYDFFEHREELENIASKIIFTGPIDKFYNYKFGELEYRSLRFETEILDKENYQGNAVVNYTEYEVPYTRIIEHKHFEFGTQDMTVISREYPQAKRETLLVLDATTGKNAVSQAQEFGQVADITGIVLTKLDGTAKGGIAVTIADEFDMPIKFIGIGEGIEDLAEFDPEQFIGGIFNE